MLRNRDPIPQAPHTEFDLVFFNIYSADIDMTEDWGWAKAVGLAFPVLAFAAAGVRRRCRMEVNASVCSELFKQSRAVEWWNAPMPSRV